MFEYQTISVSNPLDKNPNLQQWFESSASKILNTLNYLSLVFCTDAFILELNNSALSHNYYTDIITFDLSDSDSEIDAEIYISIDRVEENSKKFGVTFVHELARVMIHGVLHLAGNSDKTPNQQEAMREKENYFLQDLKMFHVEPKNEE
ncbi:MAG: rRNA maturation RNase YbeY [Flavobacteriales bacterium]|nr:rRNA maturation RNase YbeY [Flavobacteriales bacterium]